MKRERLVNITHFFECLAAMYMIIMFLRTASTSVSTGIFSLQGFHLLSAFLFASVCSLWKYSYKSVILALSVVFFWFGAAWCKVGADMVLSEREIVQTIEVGIILYCFFSVCIHIIQYIRQRKIRVLMRLIVLMLFGISCLPPLLVIGYYIVSGGHMLSANILLTLFQTNFDEVKSYLIEQNILLWAAISFMILLITGCAIYIMSILEVEKRNNSLIFNFIAIITVLIIFLPKLNSNFMINMYFRVVDTIHEYEKYNEINVYRQTRLERMKDMFQSDDLPQLHVLVIGEAAVREHLSAFGYHRPTTPWMDDILQKTQNVFAFPRAYSNHIQTVMVIQEALTSQNQYTNSSLLNSKSLTEVASSANYKTYWISNQMHYNTHDTPITTIAGGTEQQIWINDFVGDKLRTTYYDEKLADYFPEMEQDKKTLLIFHLMGCHNVYSDRYPAKFEKFSDGEDERVNSYDNCILYNDYVLSLLYKKAAEHKNFMSFTFLSDHGEDPDHSLTHDYSKFTWYMAHIPFVMIFSEKYAQNHKEMVATLKNNRDKYWTSDLLYDLMLHVLGIRDKSQNNEKYDLASAGYNMPREKLTIVDGEKYIKDDDSCEETQSE